MSVCYTDPCRRSNDVKGDGKSIVAAYGQYQNKNDGHSKAFRAFNISFHCQRNADEIDSGMQDIYDAVLDNRIAKFMKENPNGCTPDKVTGHCGHMRRSLSECRCLTLCRMRYPHLRTLFETRVADTIEAIAKANKAKESINIAIFASGGLHGELAVMVKVIEKIKNIFSGLVKCFLIDFQYAGCIEAACKFAHSATKPSAYYWKEFIGNREDLNQFLEELSLVLPRTIQVAGAVFGSSHDYIERAQHDKEFRHDLLIAADPENTEKYLIAIQANASRSHNHGIVLAKVGAIDAPAMCEVHDSVMPCTVVPPLTSH